MARLARPIPLTYEGGYLAVVETVANFDRGELWASFYGRAGDGSSLSTWNGRQNAHVRVVRGGPRWYAIGVTALSTKASCRFLHEFSQEFGHLYVIALHSSSVVGVGNDPYGLALVDRLRCRPRPWR